MPKLQVVIDLLCLAFRAFSSVWSFLVFSRTLLSLYYYYLFIIIILVVFLLLVCLLSLLLPLSLSLSSLVMVIGLSGVQFRE